MTQEYARPSDPEDVVKFVEAYDPALDDEPTERLLTVGQYCARDGQISLTIGVHLDMLSDEDVIALEQTFRVERYKRGLL